MIPWTSPSSRTEPKAANTGSASMPPGCAAAGPGPDLTLGGGDDQPWRPLPRPAAGRRADPAQRQGWTSARPPTRWWTPPASARPAWRCPRAASASGCVRAWKVMSPCASAARGDYLVHVFNGEPHVLRLRAGTDIVHAGATLIATLALDGGARRMPPPPCWSPPTAAAGTCPRAATAPGPHAAARRYHGAAGPVEIMPARLPSMQQRLPA